MRKTFIYNDELNDDFASNNIVKKPLKVDYPYVSSNPFFKVVTFVAYRMIATPIVFLFNKIGYHERIYGRKKIKSVGSEGCFLYGNHTRGAGDAFTPSLAAFPKKAYIIVNDKAVSVPGLGTFVRMTGALPLPDTVNNTKKFLKAVRHRANSGCAVFIYPEAHIWPFYTGIRPFGAASFRYPAESGKPVFAVTTVYRKRKLFNFVRTEVYIDGPFYADKKLSKAETTDELRRKVYEAMCERSKLSDYKHHTYVKK